MKFINNKNKKRNNATIEITKKAMDGVFDIFKTDTFKCTAYFLNYIYQNDLESLKKYTKLYNELTDAEKMQVLVNVTANLKERNKDKKGKVKTKKDDIR